MKLFHYVFLALAIMVLSSCEIHNSYPEDITNKQVFRFEVKASDWASITDQNGLNRYYRCRFNLTGVTSYMINNGAVMGYIEFDNAQQALPYTRHYENLAGDRWTRTVDFDYSRNDVHFYVTNNDFINDPPETMFFRLVFMW